MYYVWSWWWTMLWIIPIVLLTWGVVSWNGRRYSSYRLRVRDDRDYDWDDTRLMNARALRATHHRGRGPRNYQRSDVRVLEDVNDGLLLSDDVDATNIDVHVNNGVALLEGTVASRFEKRCAENIVDAVAGVSDVENRLIIGQPGQPALSSAGAAPQVSAPTGHA